MSTLFYPLTVRSVQPDTAEAAIVSFDVPDELREQFAHVSDIAPTLLAAAGVPERPAAPLVGAATGNASTCTRARRSTWG